MIDRYILNDQGEPAPEPDIRRWAAWYEVDENRIVQQDEVGDAKVSTVFLAIDHSFLDRGHGRPVLWESMVFGGPLDGEQRRYTSKAEAIAGHAELVAKVRKALQ